MVDFKTHWVTSIFGLMYPPARSEKGREGRHHQFSYDEAWTVRVHQFRIIRPIIPQREAAEGAYKPMPSQSQLYGPNSKGT